MRRHTAVPTTANIQEALAMQLPTVSIQARILAHWATQVL